MHTTELSTKGGRRTYLTAGATGEINNNPRYYHSIMAKRTKRNYGMKKMEPAVQTIYFTKSLGSEQQETMYLDLSQIASLQNRRFYRQGITWAVGGFKMMTDSSSGITISKLPDTWVTHQAYKQAFEAWNRQQIEALEESQGESATARFRDFKVFADAEHVAKFKANADDLNQTNVLPADLNGGAFNTGEWEPSQIVIPSGTGVGGITVERYLHVVGVNFNGNDSRGVIEGYADSRAFPQSPDPVSADLSSTTNWMARMFDTGETFSDVLDNATDKNDNLPYPQTDYPGGEGQAATLQLHDLADVTTTTVGGATRLKGGNFPCGLIRIDLKNKTTSTASYAFTIDLIPGTHRGYMCESMLEA
jgi:hypothetical protein